MVMRIIIIIIINKNKNIKNLYIYNEIDEDY